MLKTEPQYLKIISTKSLKKCTEYRLEYPTAAFKQAACAGTDTETFFPAGDTFDKETIRLLSKVCNACPIKNQCLEWALSAERYGYWGGTTPQERVRIRRYIKWTLPTVFNIKPSQRYGN